MSNATKKEAVVNVRRTVYIPEEASLWLKKMAGRERRSVSNFITALILREQENEKGQ
jgi:predicted CopG family antitoxin